MSIAHLTLLLLVPTFVSGMYFQFHRHRVHHAARLPGLFNLPRHVHVAALPQPPDYAPSSIPYLVPHFRCERTTEIHLPMFRIEWESKGRLFESYVHADTIDDAIATFSHATGIEAFSIAGTRVEA